MIKKVAVTGAAPTKGIVQFASEVGVDTTLAAAQYSATPTTLLPLTSITVTKPDGTDVVITAVSAATNEATLSTILRTELNKIGYELSEIYGVEPALPSVKISSQTLTVISELTFKSMVASSGSPNFTKKSTRAGKSTMYKTTGSTTNPTVLTVNGTARSDAHAWTYGTTSTATVKGYIETALATEITAGTVISVAVADTGTQYGITIEALAGTTILLNGTSFTQTAVDPYWK